MKSSREQSRLLSNSPFEALLAVSINLDEASRSGSKHDASQKTSPTEVSSGEYSELDSAVDTAMGSAFAEGVGTSGGGESGDTDYHSDSSGVFQATDGAKAESSEARSGPEFAKSSRARSAAAKKQRMVWTVELHKRFLNAVNHLGMDNAVPKVILKMMNVDGMTRENVASHLQKYRLHLKHQAKTSSSKPAPTNAAPAKLDAISSKPFAPLATERGNSSSNLHSRASILVANHQAHMSLQAYPAYAQTCVGGTALGLPLSSPLASYQVAGKLIVGAPAEHIPPQAWAAGVPGYDALQRLQLIPEAHKAALLQQLTAPRPLQENLTGIGPNASEKTALRRHPPPVVAAPRQSPILDIAPLTTTSPTRKPA